MRPLRSSDLSTRIEDSALRLHQHLAKSRIVSYTEIMPKGFLALILLGIKLTCLIPPVARMGIFLTGISLTNEPILLPVPAHCKVKRGAVWRRPTPEEDCDEEFKTTVISSIIADYQ
jgi:hypothetical protein